MPSGLSDEDKLLAEQHCEKLLKNAKAEEKRLADLAKQYCDRLVEQAKDLEQKYKNPATSEKANHQPFGQSREQAHGRRGSRLF